ncbi:unnamed protein product [Microthlaspi erraticum]|uniref:F-box domain-containing protein n=1 Tax=Microthlaspi erraticum TaxID=1685480 RepID=A0A6D2HTB7_9BRAS|nr:unnamed protein product [Microthlaspi erraticum]
MLLGGTQWSSQKTKNVATAAIEEASSRSRRESFIIPATNPLLRCADLTIPWLNPHDISAFSQTCKTLSLISRPLIIRRYLDATLSLDNSIPHAKSENVSRPSLDSVSERGRLEVNLLSPEVGGWLMRVD